MIAHIFVAFLEKLNFTTEQKWLNLKKVIYPVKNMSNQYAKEKMLRIMIWHIVEEVKHFLRLCYLYRCIIQIESAYRLCYCAGKVLIYT